MKTFKFIILILLFIITFLSCKKNAVESTEDSDYIFTAPISKEKLPDDLIWLTNDTDPVYASLEAKKGGTIYTAITSFPLTFRVVGPDSNTGIRSSILGNQMGLLAIHPNTSKIVPELATHWAFGKDKKSMYFKLNKNARWSDGKLVTAQDFAFTVEFMRSKHIVAPWYNDYYEKEIDKVEIFDDYTLGVFIKKQSPDIFLLIYDMRPIARHFYGKIDKNFVEKYNWKIVPNTGPYQISKYIKGKQIIFERKKDWWAKDHKYYKNRFNVDKVIVKVIKDENIIWELFKKGQISTHGITPPEYWHDKAKGEQFDNGYIHKIWFFNDLPQPSYGLYLNQDKEIFKDKNVRYAFAHAINTELLINKLLRNEYYILDHGNIGYGLYSNYNIKARKYDIDKVEYYMKKSGWKRGDDGIWEKDKFKFSVEITYSADFHTQRLVILKEEAKKAGVELKLVKLDGAASYKKVIEKKHDVAWWGWSTSVHPQYWQGYHSDNAHKPQTNNITNTDDPDLDILIDKYRNSLDEKARIKLSLKIQEKIYNNCAYVPTYMVPYTREAYWRWLKLPTPAGTKVSDVLFSIFSDNVYGMTTGGLFWYDETLHKETLKAMKKGIKFNPVTIIDKTYMMEILKNKDK